MNSSVSSNTQAILLLTAPLITRRGGKSTEFLTLGEYNRLAKILRNKQREPADLLGPEAFDIMKEFHDVFDRGRLTRLLERGFLLTQTLDNWQTRSIWVISRADHEYPARIKSRLKESAPPVLYGCGDLTILNTGGLAIVGSRKVDGILIEYTESIGRLAARSNHTVVSGGARGIDQSAMGGALQAGGQVIGVLAENLNRLVLSRDLREFLMNNQLVLISPYDPSAGFNVGHAMQRNKIIYALADAALVVSSDLRKGGTWAGAIEQLEKFHFVPVYVRSNGEPEKSLKALQDKGAFAWPNPSDPETFAEVINTQVAKAKSSIEQRELALATNAESVKPLSHDTVKPRDFKSTVIPELNEIAEAIKCLKANPHQVSALASTLGFEPSLSPVDLLGGQATPLNSFLDAKFGVNQLFRIGGINTETGTAGLYVAVLNNWGGKSSERDRPRRRLARALVEFQKDNRVIFIMVPNQLITTREAEFVLPRSSADLRKESTAGNVISTIRALVDLEEPSRFHRELLRDLSIRPGISLLEISQQWQKAFSVERATKKFYQEYTIVRDRVAQALKEANTQHPVVSMISKDEARAWATRQLGRTLFMWFLQSKRWLGYDWQPSESSKYLTTLWSKREQAGGYYGGILLPLFFKALARRNPGQEVRDILGYTPYLNGGLFRRNHLEDRIEEGGRVTLPDELFDPKDEMSVLGLLSRYRFTTRESTPDDQSVDPDPELLGRVFENLYQGDERHDTGTYYTPREIVQFMCRQVLDGYLCDTAGVHQELLDWIRKQVTEPDEDKHLLSPNDEEALVNALEGVRVCDPAVGSGAFLLGMMQEIVQLRRGILHTKKHYIEPEEEDTMVAAWKRRAITWSLYGVDINPEAVEICQLRLWLSLVLDLTDPTKVEPLPNLDFRIVAGDSLIDRVADITFTASLPRGVYQPPLELGQRVGHEEQQIDHWRREFEATQDNPARLKELRDNIARAQMRIVRYHVDYEIGKVQDEVQMRSGAGADKKKATKAQTRLEHLKKIKESLNPNAPYQKPFLWPVAFPEVLSYGGFDIVLANPPYVRMEKIENADERIYHATFSQVKAARADILVYFYARALQILKVGGWLAFITSNKYMRVAYGQGLREYLVKQLELRRIIDFGDLPIFDAKGKQVASYPAVLIGRRNGKTEENTLQIADLTYPIHSLLLKADKKVNPENVRWVLEDMQGVLSENEIIDYPQILLRRQGWILEDPILVRLFDRLMSQGISLSKFVQDRIYRGVVTGLNEAFVIDQRKCRDLSNEDPRSAELIKPWLRGQDIKRWRPDWQGLYVVFACRGTNIDNYPAIREHLAWFREKLEKRATSHLHPWFELQQPQEGIYHEFKEVKIVWGNLGIESRFALDETGTYIGAPANMLIPPVSWLLTIMNSSLLNFIYPKLTVSRGGSFQEFKIGYISPSPIFVPPKEVQTRMIELQNKLMNPDNLESSATVDIVSEIDELVFDVYKVGSTERALLKEWKQSRLEQAGDTAEAIDDKEIDEDDE